jgi:histone H4
MADNAINGPNGWALAAHLAGIGGVRHRRRVQQLRRPGVISNGDLRRLARRGGVQRISSLVYSDARQALKEFLSTVIKDSTLYTLHGGRKTVTADDVVMGLRRQGRQVYGFGL